MFIARYGSLAATLAADSWRGWTKHARQAQLALPTHHLGRLFNTTSQHVPTHTLRDIFIMSNTVKVSGISSQTGEKEIRDFFSFWSVCSAQHKHD